VNARAVAWLEEQPIDFYSALDLYAERGDSTALVPTTLFSLKDDHETVGATFCHFCTPAARFDQLDIIGD
jgi:hypothetical protein